MPIDIGRIVVAAIEAATQPQQPPAPPPKSRKPRLSTGKAMLVGAGVVTAGRLIAGPKAREMLGSVQQRITDSEWFREDEEPAEDETDSGAEDDFGEEEHDADEPTAASDDDFDDEGDPDAESDG
jgi:hypothetical protein